MDAVAAGPPPRAQVTVVTRVGCHLCDEAQVSVARLAEELEFDWQAVDVDAAPDLQDAFGDRVPVVLIDGREHAYWRLEEDRFRAAITAR